MALLQWRCGDDDDARVSGRLDGAATQLLSLVGELLLEDDTIVRVGFTLVVVNLTNVCFELGLFLFSDLWLKVHPVQKMKKKIVHNMHQCCDGYFDGYGVGTSN
jgi:hypothetical protein